MSTQGGGLDRLRRFFAITAPAVLGGCTFLPAEFNLSPFYRHRLDEQGTVLELDVAWPIFHYETTPDGGTDFRIRPFYRRVTEPEDEPELSAADGNPDFHLAATEHQFVWPLGRVRSDAEQTTSRLWPLWSHTARLDNEGRRETDWYFLFPFVWGGSREDDGENYFGIFPIYADFPSFLVYDRFQAILFPLYLHLEKAGRDTHIFLWPFIGYSDGPSGYWHRILPLYSWDSTDEHTRLSIAWPFLHWGREHIDTDDPTTRYFLWPLFGQQWSETGRVSGWTALWPFFQSITIRERLRKLDLFWPIFRFEEDKAESSPLWRLWVFPFFARTITDVQSSWNFIWPLIWWREYADPEGTLWQRYIVPFFAHTQRERDDGTEDEFTQIWPFWHHESTFDEREHWRVPSILPWRAGNTYGVHEAYDFLWTFVKRETRAPEDHATYVTGNLYTSRTRGAKTQASVPLLFNYESDDEGSTLRLFQFIPIPLGGAGDDE